MWVQVLFSSVERKQVNTAATDSKIVILIFNTFQSIFGIIPAPNSVNLTRGWAKQKPFLNPTVKKFYKKSIFVSPSHWTQLTEWVAESISLSLTLFAFIRFLSSEKEIERRWQRKKFENSLNQDIFRKVLHFSISLVIVITLVYLTSCDVMELSKL